MDLNELGLSEEQLAAVTEHVAGLKNKNEELLSEKKTALQLAQEQENAAKAKDEALTLAEEEKLKIAGDMEGLKAHYEKQKAEEAAKLREQAEVAKQALLSRDTSELTAQILQSVKPDMVDLVKPLLAQTMSLSYGEDGQLIQEFKTNDGVVSSKDEFISWASKNSDTWKKVLIAADSSGGGATQSHTPNAQMSKTETIRHKYGLSS